MNRFRAHSLSLRKAQAGALTLFTAVLILILLTEVIIYSVQVGVFEQRKSSNEMMQKLAFHTADSAIQQAKQFMSANALQAASGTTTGGWLTPGAERWQPCSGVVGTEGEHPCFGEPVAALRAGTYFYEVGGSNELPVDPDDFRTSTTERVTLHALLCMLEIDRTQDPIVQGCTTEPDLQDSRYFLITLLARGEADCDGGACGAEALVTEKIGSFGPGGGEGGPGAPLTARTSVPLSGTVEIVPNPNGGGVGVPVSSWVNSRTSDPPGYPGCALGTDPISPNSGSYATCERHEWYGMAEFPSDYKCPTNNCSCSKADDRLISYADGNERVLGIDIVPDDQFPCDLWKYSFGVDKADYELVKEWVPRTNWLTDCSTLDENSVGPYWIEGTDCDLKDQVGSATNPVFLILVTEEVKINAGAEVFGVMFISNAAYPNAEFTGNGHGTVYGAVVMDAVMEHFNGTFQIVYLEDIIEQVVDRGAFGEVAGGWTDFHTTWR